MERFSNLEGWTILISFILSRFKLLAQRLILIHFNSARFQQNMFQHVNDLLCSWCSEWMLKKAPASYCEVIVVF
jgi:hypothetical protein